MKMPPSLLSPLVFSALIVTLVSIGRGEQWSNLGSSARLNVADYADSKEWAGSCRPGTGADPSNDIVLGNKTTKEWCKPRCTGGDGLGGDNTKEERTPSDLNFGDETIQATPESLRGEPSAESEGGDLTKATEVTEDAINQSNLGSDKGQTSSNARSAPPKVNPILQKLVDSIILSPGVRDVAGKGTQISFTSKAIQDSPVNPEGVDIPLPGIIGLWGEVTFQVKQDARAEQRGGVIAKVAGVYPDRLSRIRSKLSEEVAEINSLFYQSVLYNKARSLSEMELDALDRQVTYETIRLEAGVGDFEKLAMARARATQAEADRYAISRKARAVANQFLLKTGLPIESLPAENIQWLFYLEPLDVNFALIAEMVVQQSQNTADAVQQIQALSNGVLFSGNELLAQKLCTVAADEALRRTRSRMDEGGSGEADLAGAEALVLGSQKKEMTASSNYATAHAMAYPQIKVVEVSSRIDPVNISIDEEGSRGDGMVWFLISVVFLLAVAVVLGIYRAPDHTKTDDQQKTDTSQK